MFLGLELYAMLLEKKKSERSLLGVHPRDQKRHSRKKIVVCFQATCAGHDPWCISRALVHAGVHLYLAIILFCHLRGVPDESRVLNRRGEMQSHQVS
jgi:hypothetical protein